jgi:hypothetical protein
MDPGAIPFTIQLPAGFNFPATSSGTQGAAGPGGSSTPDATAAGASTVPVDTVSISGTRDAGTFTAVAGDTFRLGELFAGSAPAGQSIAGYRVALGSGGGQMLLNNVDVSSRTSCTADEFAHLTYTAGDDGTQQSLVVVAQTGTRLAKALAFIKAGDCLVVCKLDRLGRSLPHLLTTITDLKKRGIAFRSLTEQMDTTTPQGEFLFHVFGALAQFERSLIQERVQAGLAAARRRGRRGGRPAAVDAEKLAAVIAALDAGATKGLDCLSDGTSQSEATNRLCGPRAGQAACWLR